eukprot:gene6171-12503_t
MIIVPITLLFIFLVPKYKADSYKILDNARIQQNNFIDGTPKNMLLDVVEVQRSLINIFDVYKSFDDLMIHQSHISDNTAYSKDFLSDNTSENVFDIQNEIKTDVHVDVAFVGFPSSSLDTIRDNWFKSLGRNDRIMATLGQSGDIIIIPGGGSIRLHFHLVQISFHVTEALQERVQKLLLPIRTKNNSQITEYYINTWEIEVYLSSLSKDIGISLAQDMKGDFQMIPSTKFTTLYILNLNLRDPKNETLPLLNYSYKNGFSMYDLNDISNSEQIQKLAEMVLSTEKPVSRVGREKDSKLTSLSSISLHSYIPRALDPDSPKLVHWRDAIQFTRTWASNFKEETKNLAG